MSEPAVAAPSLDLPFLGSLAPYRARVESLPEEKLAAELLHGFQDPVLGPVPFAPDPSPEQQLYHLFCTLSPAAQARFKAATIRAIEEWDVHASAPEVLESLASLAVFVRATGAIRHLRHILLDHPLFALCRRPGRSEDASAYDDLVETLLGVLLGFAPSQEVQDCFEQLLGSDEMDPGFAGLVLVGLCRCEPRSFARYVPRFLNLFTAHPEAFPRVDVTMHKLVGVLTLKRIAAQLDELQGSDLQRFLTLLCREPSWRPAFFKFEGDQGFLRDERRYSETRGAEYPINVPVWLLLDMMSRVSHGDPVGETLLATEAALAGEG